VGSPQNAQGSERKETRGQGYTGRPSNVIRQLDVDVVALHLVVELGWGVGGNVSSRARPGDVGSLASTARRSELPSTVSFSQIQAAPPV